MSQQHKDALALGRSEGHAVRTYLEALRAHKPKRGRKRTPDSVQKRLDVIEEMLVDAMPFEELQLVQERRDLQTELAEMGNGFDMDAIEAAFIAVVKSYSERQGISYASWREVGVDARVLKAGGLPRSA